MGRLEIRLPEDSKVLGAVSTLPPGKLGLSGISYYNI